MNILIYMLSLFLTNFKYKYLIIKFIMWIIFQSYSKFWNQMNLWPEWLLESKAHLIHWLWSLAFDHHVSTSTRENELPMAKHMRQMRRRMRRQSTRDVEELGFGIQGTSAGCRTNKLGRWTDLFGWTVRGSFRDINLRIYLTKIDQ